MKTEVDGEVKVKDESSEYFGQGEGRSDMTPDIKMEDEDEEEDICHIKLNMGRPARPEEMMQDDAVSYHMYKMYLLHMYAIMDISRPLPYVRMAYSINHVSAHSCIHKVCSQF